jgi:hypothetical protein
MFELLSIVITGRNQAVYLPEQFRQLRKLNITTELLYVDRNSSDNSIKIASNFTQNIFCVEGDSTYPAAGRWVGTIASEFEWILYLEANQILTDEFVNFLNDRSYLNHGDKIAGFVGRYFLSSREELTHEVFFSDKFGGKLDYFDGAVLLKADDVRTIGNWNPSIFEYDGIDLISRLSKQYKNIISLDIPMVRQKEYKTSKESKTLFPSNGQNWGFGQLWISQLKHSNVLTFLRINPYPFLLGILWIHLSLTPNIYSTIGLFFVYGTISVLEGPGFTLTHTLNFFKAVLGIFFYRFKKPRYKKYGF